MDILIPYAICDDPAARAALTGLRLPRLEALLTRLVPEPAVELPADSPIGADEHLLAAARGLDPQAPAWAALRARELGLAGAESEAWAYITPSHWQLGQARVTLLDPQALDLREDESRTLLAAMQPYFAEDGISLQFEQPTRWLARGSVFASLASASPERVIGRDVAPWLPAAPVLRRLQNEMQMLLYTHEVNEARARRGAQAVNSFWISGSGALPDGAVAATVPQIVPGLSAPALQGDWATWARAWQTVDAWLAAPWAAVQAGHPVTLTLCSELTARRYRPATPGVWAAWRRRLSRPRLSEILVAA